MGGRMMEGWEEDEPGRWQTGRRRGVDGSWDWHDQISQGFPGGRCGIAVSWRKRGVALQTGED